MCCFWRIGIPVKYFPDNEEAIKPVQPPAFTTHQLTTGGFRLRVDGFTFSQKHVNKYTIKWRCTKYKSGCTAVCETNIERSSFTALPTTHNHTPCIIIASSLSQPAVPPQETAPPSETVPPSETAPSSETVEPVPVLAQSRKKKKTLIVDGFTFLHRKSTGSGHLWRCNRNKDRCKSTAKTNAAMDKLLTPPGPHNHGMFSKCLFFK